MEIEREKRKEKDLKLENKGRERNGKRLGFELKWILGHGITQVENKGNKLNDIRGLIR